MTIERVNNGWIVKNNYTTYVYTTIEAALDAVYRGVSPDWCVGDRVVVHRRQGEKEQP